MKKKAWYIGCNEDQIADRVIVIGDPGRVKRLSSHLNDVEALPVNRGLATVTGKYNNMPVTLAAFGMGAPIATIVLHELAELGARVFLRIGTSMCLPPAEVNDFIVADSALSFEGTSASYCQSDKPPKADPELTASVIATAKQLGYRCQVGRFASFDAFYRDMFALDGETALRIKENFRVLVKKNVRAIDMETSALLSAGSALNCKVSSLCVNSVNGITQHKMPEDCVLVAEQALAEIALNAITKTLAE